MIRVSSLEDSIAFFEVLGLHEIRRRPDEKGRYTNVFLAAPGDEAAAVELTYNWDPEPYTGGRNFGHLAYAVDNIYDTCSAFIARGVTINRPPRDGRMAFIRTPDGISIELLQAGEALPPAEPWTSMANTGSWQSVKPLAWIGSWRCWSEGRPGALPWTGARPRTGRRGTGGDQTARRRWHDDGAGDLRDAVRPPCRRVHGRWRTAE